MTLKSRLITIGVTAIVAATSACSGNQNAGGSAPFAPAAMQRHAVGSATAVGSALAPRPLNRRSWMKPAALGHGFTYVSDFSNGVVYAYSYPTGHLTGAIYGAGVPRGMCLNRAGQIWITDGSGLVRLYVPGVLTPLQTLRVTGYDPLGCSVNPKNGDLAVSNLNSSTGGQGSVTIFSQASGSGRTLLNKTIYYFDFLSYDAQGNLFADGQDSGGGFHLAELKNGKFKPITVTGATINFPGGVQVVDGVLTVGDQAASGGTSVIYQMSETGQVSGSTQLSASADCVQYYIYKNVVTCPNAAGPNVSLYDYPAGGNPNKTLRGQYVLPIGSIISP